MTATVYCYYDPVLPGQVEEIAIWKLSWERYGWNPVVLNHSAIEGYPGLPELERRLSLLPTVNPKAYEMACYLRWLALALVGGGLLTDYDCVNVGFTPEEYATAIVGKALFSFGGHGPGVFYADREAALTLVETFASHRPTSGKLDNWFGAPHVSDLMILAIVPFESVELCRRPGEVNPAAKIVHCSHDAVHHMGTGKQRCEVMREILESTEKGPPC